MAAFTLLPRYKVDKTAERPDAPRVKLTAPPTDILVDTPQFANPSAPRYVAPRQPAGICPECGAHHSYKSVAHGRGMSSRLNYVPVYLRKARKGG